MDHLRCTVNGSDRRVITDRLQVRKPRPPGARRNAAGTDADLPRSFVRVGLGLRRVFGPGRVLGRAVGGEELQHPRTGVAEVVEGARGNDADIPVAHLAFGVTDFRNACPSDEIQKLVMALVHLTTDLAAFGYGHQHELRLVTGPENLAELVGRASEFDDWKGEVLCLGRHWGLLVPGFAFAVHPACYS